MRSVFPYYMRLQYASLRYCQITVTFRSGNTNVMPRSPLEMDSVGLPVTKCAPYVGGDTVEILRDLGYTEEEIAAMCASGAVATEQQV